MKSPTRTECEYSVYSFAETINLELSHGKLLYVGIAGDPPGGEYSKFFPKFQSITCDADSKWNPDIVLDITKFSEFQEHYGQYDVVVCVQVIEHIANLHAAIEGLNLLLKPGGFLIIDCPWNYPYHAEPPSFGDYWRITKDGFRYLLNDKFSVIKILDLQNNTSVLAKKIIL